MPQGKERNGSPGTGPLPRWATELSLVVPTQAKGTFMQGAFLGHLAPAGAPPGGWKKVGEKPSFSPRASGGVSFRYDRYFGLAPK